MRPGELQFYLRAGLLSLFSAAYATDIARIHHASDSGTQMIVMLGAVLFSVAVFGPLVAEGGLITKGRLLKEANLSPRAQQLLFLVGIVGIVLVTDFLRHFPSLERHVWWWALAPLLLFDYRRGLLALLPGSLASGSGHADQKQP